MDNRLMRPMQILVAIVALTCPVMGFAQTANFCADQTDAVVCEDFASGSLDGFNVYNELGGNGPFDIYVGDQQVVFEYTGGFDAASLVSTTEIQIGTGYIVAEADVLTDSTDRSQGGVSLESTDGSRSTNILWGLQADDQAAYLWVQGPGVNFFRRASVAVIANSPNHLKLEIIGKQA